MVCAHEPLKIASSVQEGMDGVPPRFSVNVQCLAVIETLKPLRRLVEQAQFGRGAAKFEPKGRSLACCARHCPVPGARLDQR